MLSRLRFLLAGALWLVTATAAMALDGGRYGDVKLAVPPTAPRGYVVLFSDAGGWTERDDERLAAIARAGAIAVGVDTDAYLDRAAREDPRCLQLLGDAEGLSRQLQRQHPGAEYYFPILAGSGKGGAVAAAILAQAPPATIGAAVSLDPWNAAGTARAFCPRVPLPEDAGEPRIYGVPELKDPWLVALTPAASVQLSDHFRTLAELVPRLEVKKLPATPDPEGFAALIAPRLAPEADVSGLPLIELPAEPRTHLMAVFLSGDGGWRDIDKTIGGKLQSLGVSVVGWDSLRYFWRKKSPEETAADLAATLRVYGAKWGADRIALIGFSFGADVLPFVYDRLPPEIRQHVALVTLLSASRAADWQIRVIGWLGAAPSAEATPLAPAIAKMPPKILQCFYGDQDTNSSCAALIGSGAEVIEKKGLHHFDGNYDLIAQQILDGLRHRISGGS